MSKPILVGAVVYDPKVVLIWEIIADFFRKNGCPMDTVFYNNYELQVESQLQGHFHIAWNSPLAWVDTVRRTGGRCRAIAMRDTDQDRVSHLVVRANSGIHSLADLRGRTVGLGAWDSPQATLIPLQSLAEAGLREGADFNATRFDVLVGKHGDHVGGERDALHALEAGDVELQRARPPGDDGHGRPEGLASRPCQRLRTAHPRRGHHGLLRSARRRGMELIWPCACPSCP